MLAAKCRQVGIQDAGGLQDNSVLRSKRASYSGSAGGGGAKLKCGDRSDMLEVKCGGGDMLGEELRKGFPGKRAIRNEDQMVQPIRSSS